MHTVGRFKFDHRSDSAGRDWRLACGSIAAMNFLRDFWVGGNVCNSEGNSSAPIADQALAGFVLLARFLGVPADPRQIAHDRGKGDEPYTLDDLLRIAKKLGLIAAAARGRAGRPRQAAAAGARRRSPTAAPRSCSRSTTSGETGALPRPARRRASGREVWTRGRPRGAVRRPAAAADDQRASTSPATSAPFDVSWFIPALVKYRKPLRDVLIASLLPAADRAGLADLLPAGDRQGAGPPVDDHARRARASGSPSC